jgi:DNA-binding MarR family transcriptional regulator
LQLNFEAPAQGAGNLTATATWALLVFDETSAGNFRLDLSGPTSAINHTRLDVRAASGNLFGSTFPQNVEDQPVSIADDLRATLDFEPSHSSLLIQADAIHLAARGTETTIHSSTGNEILADFLPQGKGNQDLELQNHAAPMDTGAALTIQGVSLHGPVPFNLDVRGLHRVEWHNATVACPGSPCPDGARPYGPAFAIPNGTAYAKTMPFLDLHPTAGTLSGQGSALYLVALGQGMDFLLQGRARFPEAVLSGECGGKTCPDPAGRTFQAEGELELHGLAPMPGAPTRLQTEFGGTIYRARIDEQAVPELAARAALVGGAAIGLVILVRVLWGPLFARNTRPVLDHPKSRAVYELIRADPGLSFQNLRAKMGYANGTTHYHLKRLLKAGLIVSYRYRNTVRFYENHGRHKQDWMEHAVLQHPELRQLHEWIREHPHSIQAQVAAATAKWGWTRSTTRNRLAELVQAALVSRHSTPRGVEYVSYQGPPS